MAKLIKSDNGYWIGKELTKNSSYSTTDEYVEINSKEIKTPTSDEIKLDIGMYLNVVILDSCSFLTFKILAKELCHNRLGMIYCIDLDAKYGVRKIYKN